MYLEEGGSGQAEFPVDGVFNPDEGYNFMVCGDPVVTRPRPPVRSEEAQSTPPLTGNAGGGWGLLQPWNSNSPFEGTSDGRRRRLNLSLSHPLLTLRRLSQLSHCDCLKPIKYVLTQ